MSPRSSRYSSPAWRAARVSSVPPVATSWASRPLSAFSVEWNDDRVDPLTHSQFQPPSAIRCSTNHAASPSTSAPSQTPFASVHALMQQSTSPPQYGRPSYSHRLFAARRSAVSVSADASTPHSRSEFSDHVVAVHGWPAPSAASGPWKSKPPGKNAPPAHWPSGSCRASSRAPNPSVATRARVAAQTSSEAPSRSRSTCQRSAGSESSSQSVRARSAIPGRVRRRSDTDRDRVAEPGDPVVARSHASDVAMADPACRASGPARKRATASTERAAVA